MGLYCIYYIALPICNTYTRNSVHPALGYGSPFILTIEVRAQNSAAQSSGSGGSMI